MIHATTAAKYTPPLVAAFSMIDINMAAGIAFGFASGWAARAGVQVTAREKSEVIWRDFFVSVLISGGCLIIVLASVQWLGLGQMGAAVLSFVLAMGGVKLLEKVHREFVEWVRRKFTDTDKIMGDRNQEAQKLLSALKLAMKNEGKAPDEPE